MLFLRDRIEESMEILKEFEPPEGYYLAFSGGKDSIVLYAIAKRAGVKFDAHYHITTADPPELVRFVRAIYPDVLMDRPEMTMWELIPKKQWPPTRVQRYCCEHLKEFGGIGRRVLTGVKKTDSVKRRNTMIYVCERKNREEIHPLLNWSDEEIWTFIISNSIEYCSLYDEGYKRLGCVGCPLAGPSTQRKEFIRWPKFRTAYLRAFGRMLAERTRAGKENIWKTPEDVMSWWLREDSINATAEELKCATQKKYGIF